MFDAERFLVRGLYMEVLLMRAANDVELLVFEQFTCNELNVMGFFFNFVTEFLCDDATIYATL